MKLFLVLLSSALLAQVDGGVVAVDGGAPGATLVLEIDGVKNDRGHLLIALYRQGDGFSETKSTAFRKETIPAVKGQTRVEVKDLPPDRYAVALIHDENDNRQLDTGFFGLPLEGFCFSRGARGVFGPPSFEQAAVTHPAGGSSHPLTVKY